MTALTASDLKAILEVLKYPYPIRFFTYIPKFPIYPYITIRKQPPVSNTSDYTDITQTDGFEIVLNIRYTRDQATEEQNQTTIESQILTTLEGTDFGASALYFESKQWTRVAVPKLYGTQSILRVSITDKLSASGEGILGSQTEIQTAFGNIKLFSLNTQEGPTLDNGKDDTGLIFRDVSGIDPGDITFEWETNPTNSSLVQALQDGEFQIVTIVKGGTSRTVVALFGMTSKRGQYDKVERATTRFTIQSVTFSQRASQIGVDAILI